MQERRFAQPKVYHNRVHDLTRVQLTPNIREIAKLPLDGAAAMAFTRVWLVVTRFGPVAGRVRESKILVQHDVLDARIPTVRP